MSVVLRPGDQAPELELKNQDEQLVRLADLRGHPVIVYFFPEAFSPGCTTEVCDFRDNKAALAAAGYVLLGVSADPPSRQREFRADHGGARIAGRDRMIGALRRLAANREALDPTHQELAAFKINSASRWAGLLSTHPPLEVRIAALEQTRL